MSKRTEYINGEIMEIYHRKWTGQKFEGQLARLLEFCKPDEAADIAKDVARLTEKKEAGHHVER